MKNCTIDKNRVSCNCTYPCPRKGICCECIAYHRKNKELPACYFDNQTESEWNRSIDNYLKNKTERR